MKIILLRPFKYEKNVIAGGAKRCQKIEEYLYKKVKDIKLFSFADFPFEVNPFHCLQANWWLFKKIKFHSCDSENCIFITPVSNLITFAACVLLLLFSKVKIAIIVDEAKYFGFQNLVRRMSSWCTFSICLWSSHLIILPSRSSANECKKMGANQKKIKIIPPGIDRVSFSNALENGGQGKGVHIVYLGYWAPKKGLIYLLQAFERLENNIYHLHIVGNSDRFPSYREKIIKYIEKNLSANHVHIYGHIPHEDLDQIWNKASMLVLPSFWESYGMVIVEAMFHGVPVIATDAGAIPELVKDGVSGLLVPPGDSFALAEAIRRLTKDSDLRRKVIRGGYKVAQRSLTWEESCRKIYNCLLELNREL